MGDSPSPPMQLRLGGSSQLRDLREAVARLLQSQRYSTVEARLPFCCKTCFGNPPKSRTRRNWPEPVALGAAESADRWPGYSGKSANVYVGRLGHVEPHRFVSILGVGCGGGRGGGVSFGVLLVSPNLKGQTKQKSRGYPWGLWPAQAQSAGHFKEKRHAHKMPRAS